MNQQKVNKMIEGNPNMLPDSEYFSDNLRKKANIFRVEKGRYMLERYNMSRPEQVLYFSKLSEAHHAAEDWVNS